MINKRIAVFSVGSSLMADDGIAEVVLNELEKRGMPDGVRLISAAGDPLIIAQEMPGVDLAIVIDAADMGLSPGEVRAFGCDEAVFLNGPTILSNHGIGLGQTVEILKAMGYAHRLRLIGIQPFRIESSPHLSIEMQKRIGAVADLVFDEIRR